MKKSRYPETLIIKIFKRKPERSCYFDDSSGNGNHAAHAHRMDLRQVQDWRLMD